MAHVEGVLLAASVVHQVAHQVVWRLAVWDHPVVHQADHVVVGRRAWAMPGVCVRQQFGHDPCHDRGRAHARCSSSPWQRSPSVAPSAHDLASPCSWLSPPASGRWHHTHIHKAARDGYGEAAAVPPPRNHGARTFSFRYAARSSGSISAIFASSAARSAASFASLSALSFAKNAALRSDMVAAAGSRRRAPNYNSCAAPVSSTSV